ncbi:MAG: hypothetical protein IPK93_02420 [Solirubrobacterales bacterium]|nr:hypothetical protein [Solirubrobacterales bacterium]
MDLLESLVSRIGMSPCTDELVFSEQLWSQPEFRSMKIGNIFPGLERVNDWEAIESSSVRTNNILSRAGVRDWATLTDKTLGNLNAIPNLGEKVFKEVLLAGFTTWSHLSEEQRASEHDEGMDTSPHITKEQGSKTEAVKRADDFLELLRAATAEFGSLTIDDVLADLVNNKEWANSRPLWRKIHDEGLDTFLGLEQADESSWEALLSFTEDDLEIVRLRIFPADKKVTLTELGEVLGVTRERVRQREARTKELLTRRANDSMTAIGIKTLVSRLTRQAVRPIERRQLRELALEAVKRTSSVGADYELRTSVLVGMCTSLVALNDRLTTPEVASRLLNLREQIPQKFPYLVPSKTGDLIRVQSEAFGIPEDWLLEFLSVRSINSNYVFWSNSLNDHAVAVLEAEAKLLSMDEIHDLVGFERNPRSLGNAVQGDSRIRRRGKELYGLDSWGGEEYEGIETELRQAIERAGGKVDLDETVQRFVIEFDVSERSVRSYASSRAFHINGDGQLMLSSDIEMPEQESKGVNPGDQKDLVKLNETWNLRVKVDFELLRGSGRQLRKAAALISGLEPDVVLGFEYEGGVVMFSWNGRQPSLGSLRNIAISKQCVEGDLLFLPLDGEEPRVCSVVRGRELESRQGASRLSLELGAGETGDPDEQLRAICESLDLALGADWSDVSDRLLRRREPDLANLIGEDADRYQWLKCHQNLKMFLRIHPH